MRTALVWCSAALFVASTACSGTSNVNTFPGDEGGGGGSSAHPSEDQAGGMNQGEGGSAGAAAAGGAGVGGSAGAGSNAGVGGDAGAGGNAGGPETGGAGGDAGSSGTASNRPPSDFMDPKSDDYAIVQFKGVVNRWEVVADDHSNIIPGIGSLEANAGDTRISMGDKDEFYVYEYTYPDDSPIKEQAGKRSLTIAMHQFQEGGSSTHGIGRIVNFEVNADALASLEASENTLDHDIHAQVIEFEYAMRMDSSVLTKYCYIGLSSDGSEAFFDHSKNDTYAPGETLTTWANVKLMSSPDQIAEVYPALSVYDGKPCVCYLENARFDCQNWDSKVVEDGKDLSCGMPDGFLDPPGETYAALRTRGTITDIENPGPAFAKGTAQALGRTIELGTAYLLSYDEFGSTYVEISASSNPVQDEASYSYDEVRFMVGTNALVAAKEAQDRVHLDGSNGYVFGMLIHFDLLGKDFSSYRVCPLAVLRPDEVPAELYGCFEKNESFGVDETLELALNLPMSLDVKSSDVGFTLDSNGCGCFDSKNNPIECPEQ